MVWEFGAWLFSSLAVFGWLRRNIGDVVHIPRVGILIDAGRPVSDGLPEPRIKRLGCCGAAGPSEAVGVIPALHEAATGAAMLRW